MRHLKAILSVVFLVVGIFLIKYALTATCDTGEFGISSALGQGLLGGAGEMENLMEINIPWPLQRGMCVGANWKMLVSMIIGMAFTWGGANGLVKNSLAMSKKKTSAEKVP